MEENEFIKQNINKVICIDTIEFMKKLPNESVDLIVTDPPYNANKGKFEIEEKSYKRINEEWDKFSKEEFEEFNIKWLKECFRVLKEGGSIYVTGMFHNAFDIHILMRDKIGFKFRNFITWFKPNAMPIKFAKQISVFAYSCEYINYFSKGKVKCFNYDLLKLKNMGNQMRDLFKIKTCEDTKEGHPSQKPLKLIRLLIEASSNKEDLVFRLFYGFRNNSSCL